MTREGSGTAATGLTAKGSSPSPVQDRGCAHTSVRSEKVERMGSSNLKLSRYSIGTGDRFAHQAKAQLQACVQALEKGIEVDSGLEQIEPRTHHHWLRTSVGSAGCGRSGEGALTGTIHISCDADHITLQTVSRFLSACDFYTIDVADFIGMPASPADIESFVKRHPELLGRIRLEGIDEHFRDHGGGVAGNCTEISRRRSRRPAKSIARSRRPRANGNFIPEVSMDETDSAQTPVELLIILAAIADEGMPIQTIAPKFSGRFNKGVDYVGDVAQFERELALDIAAIAYAVQPIRTSCKSQAERALRQRQILDLSRDPCDHEAVQRGRAPKNRRDHLARRADRPGRSRRRRAGAGERDLCGSLCAS